MTDMKLPLIALKGAKSAGKDTLATLMVQRLGYERQAFADSLKYATARAILVAFPSLDMTQEAVLEYLEHSKRKDPSSLEGWARPVLQGLGMAGRDLMGQDYWTDRVRFVNGVIITDLRMPNEAAIVKKVGGLIWHIDRHGLSITDEHITETASRSIFYDAVIVNDGTPEHMFDQAMNALDTHVTP